MNDPASPRFAADSAAHRAVTLLVDRPRGTLPPFVVEAPWWQEAADVVEGARTQFGIEVTVLRIVESGTYPGGAVTYLVECDDLGPVVDAGVELAPWTGPDPDEEHPLRPLYARSGGPAELLAWATDALESAGRTMTGPPMQGRTWNLAATWRLETDDGAVWVKATPAMLGHEAAVLELARTTGFVPPLIAGVPGRVLMDHVAGVDGYDVDSETFLIAVDRLRAIQRAVDPTRAAAAGVPRFGTAQVQDGLDRLLDAHGHQLRPDARSLLRALRDEAADRLSVGSLPDTLVHGDLHGGNLRLTERGPIILDWGDATIGHPLFDLAAFESYTPDWDPRVFERWLATWGDTASGSVVDAWTAVRPLAALRLAMIYRAFVDNIEPSEHPYHESDIVPALEAGLSPPNRTLPNDTR